MELLGKFLRRDKLTGMRLLPSALPVWNEEVMAGAPAVTLYAGGQEEEGVKRQEAGFLRTRSC